MNLNLRDDQSKNVNQSLHILKSRRLVELTDLELQNTFRGVFPESFKSDPLFEVIVYLLDEYDTLDVGAGIGSYEFQETNEDRLVGFRELLFVEYHPLRKDLKDVITLFELHVFGAGPPDFEL